VLIGTLVGVLPGIGTAGSVAALLPFTVGLPPATAIILLADIWDGAMHDGSTTSILVNIPGESSSVVTCLDGNQMDRQGRDRRSLGISAIGSFKSDKQSTISSILKQRANSWSMG
jgi:putative tricarboxylic transport membrane protein